MKNLTLARQLSLVIIGLLFVTSGTASDKSLWQLNSDKSKLHFVSTKKSSIAEVNTFKTLSGDVYKDGKANISVDLNSVETNIEIRNERMKKHLFNTSKYNQANVSTMIDTKLLAQLKKGESRTVPIKFKLSLHGKEVDLTTDVSIIRKNKNQLLVSTVAPVIIDAKSFDLVPGIEKLKELAKLSSISSAVPVSFHLQFDRKN
ncbi:YceI family protein [Pleionea sediminis]|uniref:YceI family protein n=1 Tax=Pleionea sediminis TaxID=2569479 RepID=UPI00118598ED|nr:YceI family protein [Pleionea sediminis]